MDAAGMAAILDAGQIDVFRAAFAKLFPHLPQPQNRGQAEIQLHLTRTGDKRCAFKGRAYSHAWLLERALPSMLPDELRPKAQQVYPVKALGVGISVNFRSAIFKGAEGVVRTAMEDAVREAAADRRLEDAAHVTARMMEAKERTLRSLFGR